MTPYMLCLLSELHVNQLSLLVLGIEPVLTNFNACMISKFACSLEI